MVYSKELAQRIREQMLGLPGFVEKKMFGGVGFLLQGNMACGVHGDGVIVRVGLQAYPQALEQEHARPFTLPGRPMTGWVVVASDGVQTEDKLRAWLQKGITFAQNLPAK